MLWKKEIGIPIPKESNPENNDQLRLISLTKFLSKTFEAFLVEWILKIVAPKLDPSQFGGIKGNSLTHYLIYLVNFILVNLESRTPTAVMTAIIDFSKAFNRMSHSRIITLMYKLGLPGWLLRMIASHLSRRTLIVKYQNSEYKKIPTYNKQLRLFNRRNLVSLEEIFKQAINRNFFTSHNICFCGNGHFVDLFAGSYNF